MFCLFIFLNYFSLLPLLGKQQAQRDYTLLTLASAFMHNPSSCHHEDNKSKGSTFADVPGECSQNLWPPRDRPSMFTQE